MTPRQSSLRAFQYMARAFEVAGFRRGSGANGGSQLRGVRGEVGAGGVRGAIDSSFNLVATHPSCQR